MGARVTPHMEGPQGPALATLSGCRSHPVLLALFVPGPLALAGTWPAPSSTLSPSQKQTGSLVMVNFYNDYVSCKAEANLSQVAGGWA